MQAQDKIKERAGMVLLNAGESSYRVYVHLCLGVRFTVTRAHHHPAGQRKETMVVFTAYCGEYNQCEQTECRESELFGVMLLIALSIDIDE